MILEYTLCAAATETPFYLPWFCQETFAMDSLYLQGRPLVPVVCLCCSPYPAIILRGLPGSFIVPRSCCAPHTHCASRGIPAPSVSLPSKETQEGRHDLWSIKSPDEDDQKTGTAGHIVKCLLPPISKQSLWFESKFVFYWNGWTVLMLPKEDERRNKENSSEFQYCNRSVGVLWERSVSFITCKIMMWEDSISIKS